jgi:hypothetical protein
MPWRHEKTNCRRGGRINLYPFLVILPFSIETIPIAHALSASRSAVSKSIATSFIQGLVKNLNWIEPSTAFKRDRTSSVATQAHLSHGYSWALARVGGRGTNLAFGSQFLYFACQRFFLRTCLTSRRIASGREGLSFCAATHSSNAERSGGCKRTPISVPLPVAGGPRFFCDNTD